MSICIRCESLSDLIGRRTRCDWHMTEGDTNRAMCDLIHRGRVRPSIPTSDYERMAASVTEAAWQRRVDAVDAYRAAEGFCG